MRIFPIYPLVLCALSSVNLAATEITAEPSTALATDNRSTSSTSTSTAAPTTASFEQIRDNPDLSDEASVFLEQEAQSTKSNKQTLPSRLQNTLNQLRIPSNSVAIWLQKVDSSQAKIAYNAEIAMQPASIMKIVTAYAALDLLGPAYTWHSKIYSEQSISKATVSAPLYFVGGGDPKLLIDKFWLLVQELKAQGIKNIDSDIILDNNFFADLPQTDENEAFDENSLRPYNVAPNPILINLQTLPIYLNLQSNTLRVSSIPVINQLKIDAKLKIVNSPCQDWQGKIKIDYQAKERNLKLSGSYPQSCQNKVLYLALFTPLQQFDYIFRSLWTGDGSTWTGKAQYGKLTESSKLLLDFVSPPLSEIIRDMNKYSLNPVARNMYLTIGQSQQGKDNDLVDQANNKTVTSRSERAKSIIASWLKTKEIDSSSLILENGSGLSRQERFSAKFLGQLLQSAWQSPIMPDLLASLPIISIDGTLKKRLPNSSISGRGYLKTGTLDNVKSLAGIVTTQQGQRWIVVMMVNHQRAASSAAAFDELLRYVMEE